MSDDNAERDEISLDAPGTRVVAVALGLVFIGIAIASAWWGLRRLRVAVEDAVPIACPGAIDEAGRDWSQVHADLLPAVFLQRQQARPPRAVLDEALADDGRALQIVDELLGARSSMSLAEALRRETELVDEWNALMDERELPWRLRLPMSGQLREASLFALSYCVLSEHNVSVDGGDPIAVLFASRGDRIGVREGWSGHAQHVDEEAFVVVDRVADMVMDQWWPAMATPDEDATPEERALHEALDADLSARVPAEVVDPLARSAGARRALIRFRASTGARIACGGGLAMDRIPLRGFRDADLSEFRAVAVPESVGGCPAVTDEELDSARAASESLRSTPGLRDATETLIALAATSTALHEARHVEDARLGEGGRPCPGCVVIDAGARTELSAYVASYGAAPLPAGELRADCGLMQRGRQHGRALRFLVERFEVSPCETLPEDVAAAMRAQEAELFGSTSTFAWEVPPPTQLAPVTR